MSNHGASLQNFNNDLVRSLEDINQRRTAILEEIKKDQTRKSDLEKMIHKIKEEMGQVKGK